MTDLKGSDGHEHVCDDRCQNDTSPECTRKAKQPGQSRKISEIKTDRRSRNNHTVNR